MKKNDIFDIEITGMADEGYGIGRINGMAVFVPYTIVGETVKAIIIKILKNYAVGKLIEIVKPSENRIKSDCNTFYQCGGCALRHMTYDEELRFKKQKVTDCITRIGGILNPKIDGVVPSIEVCRYRNKSQFPVTPSGVGMYAQHSHRLIETDDCLIASRTVKPIIQSVKYWMKSYNIPAYDENSGKGIVRNIYARTGHSGTLVTVVTATENLPHKKELVEELLSCGTEICGIIQNINNKNTNVVLGRKNITLYGTPYLTDFIGNIEFRISPMSFYQVNKRQTEKLYSIAKEYAGLTGHETVLDMYCGIGTIGLFMADKAKIVVGVETVPEAVKDAKINAEINGITNCEYYAGKAEILIDTIIKNKYKPDVAILDPPRKGCDRKLLDTLSSIKSIKKIVYISCKPSTLARDIKYLSTLNFYPQKITPVDMFPRTPHVETVVMLSTKKRRSNQCKSRG